MVQLFIHLYTVVTFYAGGQPGADAHLFPVMALQFSTRPAARAKVITTWGGGAERHVVRAVDWRHPNAMPRSVRQIDHAKAGQILHHFIPAVVVNALCLQVRSLINFLKPSKESPSASHSTAVSARAHLAQYLHVVKDRFYANTHSRRAGANQLITHRHQNSGTRLSAPPPLRQQQQCAGNRVVDVRPTGTSIMLNPLPACRQSAYRFATDE